MWLWNQHIVTNLDCDIPHEISLYEQVILLAASHHKNHSAQTLFDDIIKGSRDS